MTQPHFGLCDACRHQRIVRSGRGSAFSMCERGLSDRSYPKYPQVPVGACTGFERREQRGPLSGAAPTP